MDSLIFQYGSAVVGGLAVVSVCIVFLKAHTFERAGFGLLFSGTILIGLPVWSSAKFAWNSEGLNVEFRTISQKLENLQSKVESSSMTSAQIKTELTQLSNAVEKKVQSSNIFAIAPMGEDDNGEVAAFILDPATSIRILGNTEEFTEMLNEKIQTEDPQKASPNE